MNNQPRILVVDDQPSVRYLLEQQLTDAGFTVVAASGAKEALALLEQEPVDLILSDLVMPDVDGLAFLDQARERFGSIPFVVITSHGTVASAVEALKRGAFDYVEKNCLPEELKIKLDRVLNYHSIALENERYREQLKRKYSFQHIVTVSPQMKYSLELAATVSKSPLTTVTLLGESGVGKEVLAQAIHFSNGGRQDNFVGVNCAAVPSMLLESELFGHIRGAFTGADRDREGKIAQASGGTLLLDEIGDMPLDLQAKLLRMLEARMFEKVGSNQTIMVDCRIIVATNQVLKTLVKEGRFREDLYHRINVFPIEIPALRERRDDIPILLNHFMSWLQSHLGKSLPGISQDAVELLMDYSWPGNVRELRNCMERAAIIVDEGELIRPRHLAITAPVARATQDGTPGDVINYNISFPPEDVSLDAITAKVLEMTLQRCGGNKSKAAEILKVNRKMFYR